MLVFGICQPLDRQSWGHIPVLFYAFYACCSCLPRACILLANSMFDEKFDKFAHRKLERLIREVIRHAILV